jgi:hypothetical protein
MPLGSALTNQIAGAVARQATGDISTVLKSVLPSGTGTNSSDTRALHDQGKGSKHLSYPENVEGDEQQGHYVMFMINVADQGKVATSVSTAGQGHPGGRLPVDTGSTLPKAKKGPFADKKFISENLNQGAGTASTLNSERPAGTLAFKRPPTVKLEKAITLYMPPSVSVTYKANYKDDEISARAQAIVNSGETIIAALTSKADFFTQDNMKKIGGSVGEGAVVVAASATKAAADTFAPGASTVAQIKSGAILGSKMELMFTDVGRRDFSFEFNFLPKSRQEAETVDEIVFTFKKHMMPSMVSSLTVFGHTQELGMGRALKIPDTFDIHYFYQNTENPYLNRISTCYLTGLDVGYGGDKYVTYEPTPHKKSGTGPPPQKTNIKLSFSEIETITRERIEQGF